MENFHYHKHWLGLLFDFADFSIRYLGFDSLNSLVLDNILRILALEFFICIPGISPVIDCVDKVVSFLILTYL